MERREFIKTTCAVCIGTMALASFIAACKSSKYISSFTEENKKIVIKKSEFVIVKRGKEKQLSHITLKPAGLQFPIAVYKTGNEYKALYTQCTHQGCELTAYDAALVCPCHGAEFNTRGNVTQGPAETDLKTFATTHDNENIYIQL